MKERPRILFITTSNLATNPRLVKEIQLAMDLGYLAEVIYFRFNNWSYSLNQSVESELADDVVLHPITGDRSSLFSWLSSTVLEQYFRITTKLIDTPALGGRANKRTLLLLQALRRLNKKKYSIIIAHNPGAMLPALHFSKSRGIPFGFDLEDYHPGEFTDQVESVRVKKLMQYCLPEAAYITAASPLILKYCLGDLENYTGLTGTINNYFPSGEFSNNLQPEGEKLKLAWFSQNIDKGRGLEIILPAVKRMSDTIELHLFGNLRPAFFSSHLENISNLVIHDPLPQKKLHSVLSEFDVGLALEDAESNLNRDICLTNKLLAYQQAGLYILASNTKAQRLFIDDNPVIGEVFEAGGEEISEALNKMYLDLSGIRSGRTQRVSLLSNKNWEAETLKLAAIWRKLIP